MVIFNALLNLSELKELYSGKPVCVCPLYKGVINALKTFEATGNPIKIPEYKSLVKLTTTFSPTTGAQVAYKLATPKSFKASQVTIPSLIGENYFFTNGENMDIIYKKESFWSDEA